MDEIEIPIPDLVPPGIDGELQFAQKEFEGRPGIPGPTENRRFEVTAYFTKNPSISNFDFHRSADVGNSCVLIEPDQILKISNQGYTLKLRRNKDGELSEASMEFVERHAALVYEKFSYALNPILDYWSYTANRPLYVDQIRIYDADRGVLHLSYRSPFDSVPLPSMPGQFPQDLLPIFALFREAKCNVSPFYRCLCYLKIMEGIFKSIRQKVRMKAEERQIRLVGKRLVVPEDEYIAKTAPQYIGKPIQHLFETEFQKDLRVAVAHFAKDGELPLMKSDAHHMEKFAHKVYLLELCCRVLIAEEERKYAEIFASSPNPEDGRQSET